MEIDAKQLDEMYSDSESEDDKSDESDESDEAAEPSARITLKSGMEPETGSNPSKAQLGGTRSSIVGSKSRVDPRNNLRLKYSLVFIYLGCVWCRWPVLLVDVHRWVMLGLLPFISAHASLPESMTRHFNQEQWNRFIIRVPPSPADLHHWTKRFVRLFRHQFGLEFPEANGPPIVLRCVRELLLPVETYHMTSSLIRLLAMDLHLPEKSDRTPGKRWSSISVSPEAKVMAAVLIVAKLCYGLDDHKRPQSKNDGIFAYFPSKETWLAELDAKVHKERMAEPSESKDDLRMFAKSNLQSFLQYCRENVVRPQTSADYSYIKQFFETGLSASHQATFPREAILSRAQNLSEHIQCLHVTPKPSGCSSERRLDSDYVVCANSVSNDHDEFARVLKIAARALGLKAGKLLVLVKATEGALEKIWKKV